MNHSITVHGQPIVYCYSCNSAFREISDRTVAGIVTLFAFDHIIVSLGIHADKLTAAGYAVNVMTVQIHVDSIANRHRIYVL